MSDLKDLEIVRSREMTEEEEKEFHNNLTWQEMRYAIGSNYHRIIKFTGCRDYIYGEDPNAYLDIVAECYDLYCKTYNDEVEYRERMKKGISSLPPGDFGRFLDESRRSPGEMEMVYMEAEAEDRKRTINKRRIEFRKRCAELNLESKFFN